MALTNSLPRPDRSTTGLIVLTQREENIGNGISLEHGDKTGQERYTFRLITPDSSAHGDEMG